MNNSGNSNAGDLAELSQPTVDTVQSDAELQKDAVAARELPPLQTRVQSTIPTVEIEWPDRSPEDTTADAALADAMDSVVLNRLEFDDVTGTPPYDNGGIPRRKLHVQSEAGRIGHPHPLVHPTWGE